MHARTHGPAYVTPASRLRISIFLNCLSHKDI
jgi:hypothetical protein